MEINTNTIAITAYTNKNLIKATAKVNKLGTSIQKNLFEVASVIASVDTYKWYEEDGFKTVHDWTAQAFGIKKTASYSLLRIGKEYVEALTNESGKIVSYGSNLYHETEKDFSMSQVEAVLPAGRPLAYELSETGKITPDMTVREIRQVVKEATKEEDDTETDTDTDTETESEKERAYHEAALAVGKLWDYAETITEKEQLANAVAALEALGKSILLEQTTI